MGLPNKEMKLTKPEYIGASQLICGVGRTSWHGRIDRRDGRVMAITPYLYYRDVHHALRFLAKAFGFRAYGVKMRGPGRSVSTTLRHRRSEFSECR
jgi:hypothetical protein